MNILFITRGFGWGHSIRDKLIINEIEKINTNTKITIISYDDGLNCYRLNGISCYDINILGSYGENLSGFIAHIKPDVVILDEEFKIIPIIKKLNIPCILITNFIPFDKNILSLVNSVNKILFAEFQDLIDVDKINTPIIFLGPICNINDNNNNAESMKNILNIKNNNKTILITLGGRNDIAAQKNNEWLINEIIETCYCINININLLIINKYLEKVNQNNNVNLIYIKNNNNLSEYYAISNLIISRGGLTTLWEIACTNTCNLAIPYPASLNIMEEIYAQKMKMRGYINFIYQYEVNKKNLQNIIGNYINSNFCCKKAKSIISVKKLIKKSINTAAQEILNI